MRRLMTTISVMSFLSLMLLSGCFESTTPLLTADDGVTLFGDSFLAVPVWESGEIERNGSDPVSVREVRRSGNQYSLVNEHEHQIITLTLVALDEKSPLYLLQLAGSDQSGHTKTGVLYAVVKPLDDTLDIYFPPDPGPNGMTAALKSAGISYSDSPTDPLQLASFRFSSKGQLLAAARIFSSRLGEG